MAERQKKPRYQCTPCKKAYSYEDRCRLKCGWVDAKDLKNTEKGWGALPGMDFIPEHCPGYTIKLPKVQEVARAWAWEERSSGVIKRYEALGLTFTEDMSDLIDMFAGEQARAEAYEMEEIRKK